MQELATTLADLGQKAEAEYTALETHLDSLQTRLGLPFEHEAKLAQLSALRGELQSLLQSDSSARAPTQPETTEMPTGDAIHASPSPAPEAAQERIKRLVEAFDTLMREPQPPLATDAQEAVKTPLPHPPESPAPRRWVETVRTSPESHPADRLEVVL